MFYEGKSKCTTIVFTSLLVELTKMQLVKDCRIVCSFDLPYLMPSACSKQLRSCQIRPAFLTTLCLYKSLRHKLPMLNAPFSVITNSAAKGKFSKIILYAKDGVILLSSSINNFAHRKARNLPRSTSICCDH